MLEKIFKLSENKTDVKTEVLAGITTFMTMAYILAVNPEYPVSGRNGFRCSIYCNSIGCIRRNIADGSTCKLSVCISTWNGVECIFCVHSCNRYGI